MTRTGYSCVRASAATSTRCGTCCLGSNPLAQAAATTPGGHEVERSAWTRALGAMCAEIDYGNFKKAVADREGGSRSWIYGDVWAILRELEHLEPETFTNTPLLTKRFDSALAYASEHHRCQLRKGTEIPYVSHLLAVSAIVLEMGGNEAEAIGALLHDVVEDGGGPAARAHIADQFGEDVALIVDANTDTDEEPKPPWKQRKTAYIESIAYKHPSALRVSLADKVHNASAITRDYRTHGEALWGRFKAGAGAEVRWYYRSLADAFEQRRDDLGPHAAGALAELRRLVTEMEESSQPPR